MLIRRILYSTAASFLIANVAYAADAVNLPPEPVEHLRVCDAYGAGYFSIPGTETCMRISGYVRTEIKGGDNVYARKRGERNRDSYAWRTRATLRSHTASETELGTMRTFIELRSQWGGGAEYGDAKDSASGQVRFAFIELGGVRVGLDESIFNHWTSYFGAVLNDDILNPLAYSRTNVISYTYNTDNGFSFIVGLEQGNDQGDTEGFRYDRLDKNGHQKPFKLQQQIDDYTPNILLGAKYAQSWGVISAVAAYDAYYSEWAGKLRLDVNVSDQFSLWIMGGLKSMKDYYNVDRTVCKNDNGGFGGVCVGEQNFQKIGTYRQINSIYGDWGGDWALWGGGSYKFNPKTSFNFQVAYEDTRTFASSANISHELVHGLRITPEIAYISWRDKYGYTDLDNNFSSYPSLKGKSAVQGTLRLQRSF